MHRIVSLPRWIGLALAGALLSLPAGCAPTPQEWAEVEALPAGPLKDARRAELQARETDEERWWDLAGWAGSLAGGLLPGAGLAVAALRHARRVRRERDSHAAAARILTGNLDQALAQLTADQRRQTLERIKQTQTAAGQRETIRAYLRAPGATNSREVQA